MDVFALFGLVALPLAGMGFIFGLSAFAQVAELKKEVQQLRNQLEGDSG